MQATQFPTVTPTFATDMVGDPGVEIGTGDGVDFALFFAVQDKGLPVIPVLPVRTRQIPEMALPRGTAFPAAEPLPEAPRPVGKVDGSGPVAIGVPMATPDQISIGHYRPDLPARHDPTDQTPLIAFSAVSMIADLVNGGAAPTQSAETHPKAPSRILPGTDFVVPTVGASGRTWHTGIAGPDVTGPNPQVMAPGQSESMLTGPAAAGTTSRDAHPALNVTRTRATAVTGQSGHPAAGIFTDTAEMPSFPVAGPTAPTIVKQLKLPPVHSDLTAPRLKTAPAPGFSAHIRTGQHFVELGHDPRVTRVEIPFGRSLPEISASLPREPMGAHTFSPATAAQPAQPVWPSTGRPSRNTIPTAVDRARLVPASLPTATQHSEPVTDTSFEQPSTSATAARAGVSAPISMAHTAAKPTAPDATQVDLTAARPNATDHPRPTHPAQSHDDPNGQTRDLDQGSPRHVAQPSPRGLADNSWVPARPPSAGRAPHLHDSGPSPVRVVADIAPAAPQHVQHDGTGRPQPAMLGPDLSVAAHARQVSTRAEISPLASGRVSTAPPAIATARGTAGLFPAAQVVPEVSRADPIPEVRAEYAGELNAETIKTDQPRDIPRTIADPKIPRQIAEQLAGAIRQGADGPVDVTLNPEELGRVRMTLSASDGTMAVSLTIERPETADLMRRNLAALGAEFRQLGYSDVTFSFAGSGGGQGDLEDGRTAATDPTGEAPRDDLDATADHAPSIAATTALDLRI